VVAVHVLLVVASVSVLLPPQQLKQLLLHQQLPLHLLLAMKKYVWKRLMHSVVEILHMNVATVSTLDIA